MFEKAIEQVLKFTRPVHVISRNYAGVISPGAATLFFVNDQGVAVTCRHVANLLISADEINQRFHAFKQERDKIAKDGKYKKNLAGLELKYHYRPESTVQIKNNFINCIDKFSELKYHFHATLDLAILEFKGYEKLHYENAAVFAGKDSVIRQGKSLCRVGFPFPEFNNFRYDQATDDIVWTNTGIIQSPSFPIDGILTRFIGNPEVAGDISGIEMSTPGLRGQSGGPLFDAEGTVFGMQFATNHLHLGFDIKGREIMQDGKKEKVSDSPFLHVGQCVHVNKIREFLEQIGIEFNQSN